MAKIANLKQTMPMQGVWMIEDWPCLLVVRLCIVGYMRVHYILLFMYMFEIFIIKRGF